MCAFVGVVVVNVGDAVIVGVLVANAIVGVVDVSTVRVCVCGSVLLLFVVCCLMLLLLLSVCWCCRSGCCCSCWHLY